MMTKENLLHKAIACYEKAGQIDDVCRCLQALGEYVEAAERYEQNNEPWQAAWLYAGEARLFYHARYLVQQTPVLDLADELSHDLILARCDAQIGSKSQAGLTNSKVIKHFPQLPLIHRQRIEEWAVIVAQHLGRFDLVATTYAIAYTTGTPESEIRWEAWALSTLGDATGVPTTPFVEPDIPFEFETVTVNRRGEIIQRRRLQAKQRIEKLDEGVTLEMVLIPDGTFIMGKPINKEARWPYDGESPPHQVTIKPFYMSKYPITQAQWIAMMGDNPSYFQGDNHPVENVSWEDSVRFCHKLSALTKKAYRLPSEAQWEYACRAGTTTPFYFGETITTDLVNYHYHDRNIYADEQEGVYRGKTTEVGIFPPNAFGLYDMHGNVREWCADLWHDNYNGAPSDGSAWLEKQYEKWRSRGEENSRLLRGASFCHSPSACSAGNRSRLSSKSHERFTGFRVCINLAL